MSNRLDKIENLGPNIASEIASNSPRDVVMNFPDSAHAGHTSEIFAEWRANLKFII